MKKRGRERAEQYGARHEKLPEFSECVQPNVFSLGQASLMSNFNPRHR
jgi:hypothetical protein